MGEIKSTLDLIMEKTRDLTLSDEEKRAFHDEEIHGKVRGWLQRHLDGQMSAEQVVEEIEGLGKEERETAVGMLRRECAKRLEPWADNGAVLSLARQAAGADTDPVEKLLAKGRTEMELQRENRIAALREQYEARGISGSAVVPNPDADPEWRRYLSEKRRDILERVFHLFE